MSTSSRVAWKNGLYLLPQHFQQADRYWERILRERFDVHNAVGWGVLSAVVTLNEHLRNQGPVVIVEQCRAIFRSGFVIDAPAVDATPPAAPVAALAATRKLDVLLTIPIPRPGQATITADRQRLDVQYAEHKYTVADDYEPSRSESLQVIKPNLGLSIVPEGAPPNGVESLKLAELVRTPQGVWLLRADYIPPCPCLDASPVLQRLIGEVVSALSVRAAGLGDERRRRGGGLEFSSADLQSFLFQQTIQQHLLVIRHLTTQRGIHPQVLFMELVRLLGALQIFDNNVEPLVPTYDHESLTESFTTLCTSIRRLLSTLFRTKCVPLPLTQTRNVWDAYIDDELLLTSGSLFLVASGLSSRNDYERLPQLCKIAESSELQSIVGRSLPGLLLEPVLRPPNALPLRDEAVCYQIRPTGELWQMVLRTQRLGCFVPRSLETLRLELFGIYDHKGER